MYYCKLSFLLLMMINIDIMMAEIRFIFAVVVDDDDDDKSSHQYDCNKCCCFC